MSDPTLCRTFQTAPAAVPGDDAKYLRSGITATGFSRPDWLVPDLEDGTAPNLKGEGLKNTVNAVNKHGEDFSGEIWPRVQWAHDDQELRDVGSEQVARLAEEAGDHIDGIVIPKVGRLDDVRRAMDVVADAAAEHGVNLDVSVIVETAVARSELIDIAALGSESSLCGLVFGPVDYTADLGGRSLANEEPSWDGLLEVLSNEASANSLVAIGGPFDQLFVERAGVTVYNAHAYADQVEREARIGLDGSWSLHPNQTVQANRMHMPTVDELNRAVQVIREFAEAKAVGTGAVTVDGQMIDEATYKNFRNTVLTVSHIQNESAEQVEEMYDDELLTAALDVVDSLDSVMVD